MIKHFSIIGIIIIHLITDITKKKIIIIACYLLLESKVALQESDLWRNPGRCHVEMVNGYIEEEVGEDT